MSIFESFGLNANPFAESLEAKNTLMDARFQSAFDPLEILPS